MATNQRRGTNRVQMAFVSKAVVVFLLVMSVSLIYVYMKNKLHRYGEQRRKLEQRVNALRHDTQLVDVQIAEWSSRAVLQRRLQEGFVRLTPIPDDRIVRLHGIAEPVEPLAGDARVVGQRGGEEAVR